MKPTIGRIVHYVQVKPASFQNPDQPVRVVHLPAIIIAVWTETCVNLQVFTDGSNSETGPSANPPSIKWITSATLDANETPQPNTWHWPEREV